MSSSLPTPNSTIQTWLPGSTSLYSLLGLQFPFVGTSQDIRRAYRRAALLHHPDRNCNSPNATTEESSLTGSSSGGVQVPFHILHRAATLLLDPARRAEYDVWFQAGGGGDGLSSGRVRRVDVGDERTFMVVLKMPWGTWDSSQRENENKGVGALRSLLGETTSTHGTDCTTTSTTDLHDDEDEKTNDTTTLDTVVSNAAMQQMFKYTEGREWEDVADSKGTVLNVLFDGGAAPSAGGDNHLLKGNNLIDDAVSQILAGSISLSAQVCEANGDVANQPDWVDPADMFLLAQEEPTPSSSSQQDVIVDSAAWARPDVALVMCRLECRCSGAYTVELPYLHLLLAEVAQHPRRSSYVIRKHVILLLIHRNDTLTTKLQNSQSSLILNHLVSISRRRDGEQQQSPTLSGLCVALSLCLQDYVSAISATTSSVDAATSSATTEAVSCDTRSGLHTEMLVAGKATTTIMRKEVCSMCSLVMGLHSVPEVYVVTIGVGGKHSTAKPAPSRIPVDADDDSLFVGLFPRGM